MQTGISFNKAFRATRKPTTRDLEWAAGFIEGEGQFNRNGGSGEVRVRQVNPDPVAKLLEIFGGRVRLEFRQPPQSNIWNWSVTGTRARGVMMTLFCLLSEKRKDQIKAAILIPHRKPDDT